MPGRYAKRETSEGFLGSIDTYAYRIPNAPTPDVDGENELDMSDSGDAATTQESTARLSASPD